MKFILLSLTILFGVVFNSTAAENPNLDTPVRAILVVPKNISPDHAKWVASKAKLSGFNTVLFRISRNHDFDTLVWSSDEVKWSKADIVNWIQHVKKLEMDIVPELKLLSHQEKFFKSDHADLMFNSVTYDPMKNEVYDLIFPLLNEIIDLFNPKAIHVGHDEIAGHNRRSRKRWLSSDEQTLPAELFLFHLSKIEKYLKERNIKTWIWGDMILSPEEFPKMLQRHLHGDFPGYGAELRRKLSRELVIVDWHNFDEGKDFQSLKTMKNEGFTVIGSSWKNRTTMKNFVDYASRNSANGMLFTPWGMFLDHKKGELQDLITQYGDLFFKAFPDE